MIGKGILPNCLVVFFSITFSFLATHSLLSEENKQPYDCLDQDANRIKEMRSLPHMTYLHTLDGQNVWLSEFYDQRGIFMGLAVYMGDGKYCPLPYYGYKK